MGVTDELSIPVPGKAKIKGICMFKDESFKYIIKYFILQSGIIAFITDDLELYIYGNSYDKHVANSLSNWVSVDSEEEMCWDDYFKGRKVPIFYQYNFYRLKEEEEQDYNSFDLKDHCDFRWITDDTINYIKLYFNKGGK